MDQLPLREVCKSSGGPAACILQSEYLYQARFHLMGLSLLDA